MNPNQSTHGSMPFASKYCRDSVVWRQSDRDAVLCPVGGAHPLDERDEVCGISSLTASLGCAGELPIKIDSLKTVLVYGRPQAGNESCSAGGCLGHVAPVSIAQRLKDFVSLQLVVGRAYHALKVDVPGSEKSKPPMAIHNLMLVLSEEP